MDGAAMKSRREAQKAVDEFRATHKNADTLSMTKLLAKTMGGNLDKLRHDLNYNKYGANQKSADNLGSLILMLDVAAAGQQNSHINDFFESMVNIAGDAIDYVKGK
jgi:hypothetical protein